MATVVSGIHHIQPERLKSFVIPREHGAWGMLLIPLITGAAVGFAFQRAPLPLVLFLIASLSIFVLRTPLEAWLGTSALRPATPSERRVVLYSIISYGAVAAFAVGWLLLKQEALGLVFIGLSAAIVFGLQANLKKIGRHTRMVSQLVGAVGLTSTAAGAYYVVTGTLGPKAFAVWALNWLFAANQIHYVQIRIHGSRATTVRERLLQSKWFLASEAATVILLATLWGVSILSGFAALAFAPLLIRGIYWLFESPKPLLVHRLGFTEFAHALAFGVLLIVAFQL